MTSEIAQRQRRKNLFEQNPENWRKKTCPICGIEFIHHVAFTPNTCNNFDCISSFLHPELKNNKSRVAGGGDIYKVK
jgi:hypothetical protein